MRKLTVMLLSGVICLMGTTSALAMKYNEAPMLRTKVAAGVLPPVEQRLPEEPLVAELTEEIGIGEYGGTLRSLCLYPEQDWVMIATLLELLIADPVELIAPGEYKGVVLRSLEVSEDGKIFTFHMRKGLKWSDGYPVTSEDVLFNYEDILLNKKLTPVFPKAFAAGGEPMKLEVIDDYTFRIRFAVPYYAFTEFLRCWTNQAIGRTYRGLLQPKHYLKQFHPRYTPMEELKPLIEEEALEKGNWWSLFEKMRHEETIGCPTLSAWIIVDKKLEISKYERNPYYFKVDPEGNQLPYIDKRRSIFCGDSEVAVMKVIAGEVDFKIGGNKLEDYPLCKSNEEKGGYQVVLSKLSMVPIVLLNLSHLDPVWQKVIGDIRFRKALDMAINREELYEAVWLGLCESSNLTPAVYDPKEADRLLDEMGLDKRDEDGWRLGPDDKRFIIPFEFGTLAGFEPRVVELVTEYWKKVGIYTTAKPLSFTLWASRGSANEIKASVHWTPQSFWRRYPVSCDKYLPDQFRSWGPAFRVWYDTDGKEGVEPPPEIKKIFKLRDTVKRGDRSYEESMKIIDEIEHLIRENNFFFAFGAPAMPTIYGENLRNVQVQRLSEEDVTCDNISQLFYSK